MFCVLGVGGIFFLFPFPSFVCSLGVSFSAHFLCFSSKLLLPLVLCVYDCVVEMVRKFMPGLMYDKHVKRKGDAESSVVCGLRQPR